VTGEGAGRRVDPAEPAVRPAPGGGLHLRSSLWIDHPDAVERIEARHRRGELDAEEAEGLTHFAREGYLVFPLDDDPARLDALPADVDRFWKEKPAELAYAYDGPARRMCHADEARERRSRYRIHDPHSHSAAALGLYLHRRTFRWVERILGEEPVAIQSLFFEYGSQQLLHRDPVVVPLDEPGHMVAAWIALEDIHPDCGPLVYVPGSHRLPYYELEPGEFRFDGRRMGTEVVAAGLAWEAEQERKAGLEPRTFTPKKGEVLLWHASLRHGGSEVRDERLTRKSFVVHYSTRRSYRQRSIGISEPVAGGEEHRVLETRELLERDGRRGFQNPMLGEVVG